MNRKVLLVDDESPALDCYQQMIGDSFEVTTALGAHDGLAVVRKQGPFAVVVSDMHMTGMDGIQFLKHVRQVAPHTVRLMLTGRADLDSVLKAVNEGCIFQFLTKPCERSLLVNAINLAVGQYHDRKEERVNIALPVRLYRSIPGLKLQSAYTVNVSNWGVRLGGIKEPLEKGEILNIECSTRKAPFRVVWTGAPGAALEGEAGLECMTPGENIWALDLGELKDPDQLARARLVQSRLLPQENPRLETLDYAANCTQARTVGGDYYDFFDMGSGNVGFVVADIAGKGFPAALLMANLQGILHTQNSRNSKDPSDLLTSVNRHFYKYTSNDRYATLFFGQYNDSTRTLNYANCGHNPPILLRKTGTVERLNATTTVLGLFWDWNCCLAQTQLEEGDLLSIYTDGITETTGESGDEFGESRLLELLHNNRDLEAKCILQKLESAAEHFRFGEQQDDLTLVIGRVR